MILLNEYVQPVVPVVLVIGGLIATRFTCRRPFDLSRALSVNAMCACCFAGPFLRFGWDKAVVAFLCIFVITSLFAVARWAEHRHYQSTLPPKAPAEKEPS